jgi:sec-independent protein translocase protein TatC
VATTIRPVGYDDRLSVVEHLDELRHRLLAAGAVFVAAFTVCLVFNHQLLSVINHPLKVTTEKRTQEGKGILGEIYLANKAIRVQQQSNAEIFKAITAPGSGVKPEVRAEVQAQIDRQAKSAGTLKGPDGSQPVTLGPGEPFSATFTVAFYFSLLISMPLILYQLYMFVLPAFSPNERRVVLPLMAMIPVLFLIGVSFGYFVVLPAAVKFLQNFNSDQFNIMLQARDYYKFAVLSLAATGLVFQLPVAILALTRMGVVTPEFLLKNWRYAIVILTVIAVLLPGTDPVSTMIEAVPLYLLYAFSIVMARFVKPVREEPGVDVDEAHDSLH